MSIHHFFQRWGRFVLFVSLSVLAAALVPTVGKWLRSSSPVQSEAPSGPRVMRVSRGKLFSGDLSRLEPHFGFAGTGCVRIETAGPEFSMCFEAELWQAGKSRLGTSKTRTGEVNEASFSLREAIDQKGQRKYRLVTAVAGPSGFQFAHTSDLDMPEASEATAMSGPVNLREPRELAEGEMVPVWAYVIYKDGHGLSLEEVPASAKWAVLVKAGWERIEGR